MVKTRYCNICGQRTSDFIEVDDTALCPKCFNMMLKAGLLYDYDADTRWHYGPTWSRRVGQEEAVLAYNAVMDIVELLK